MTGNQRSDRAMPELAGNRAGNACVMKDYAGRYSGPRGKSGFGCQLKRMVAAAIGSQSSPKTSQPHARERPGAIQCP
jgi:hypothetical protein